MKYIKIIHASLGMIPFIWFLSFLLILLAGTIHLGYIPKYGNPIDPSSLNIEPLGYFHAVCGILAYFAFYLWLIMAVVLLIFFRKNFSLNKVTTVLFFVGISGFYIFKYVFTEYFAWVMD